MRHLVAVFTASLFAAFVALTAGCASGPDLPDALAGEKTYLDDMAMESFNANLQALSGAVDRGEDDIARGLRTRISENARMYQRALLSALYDDDSRARRAMAAVLLGFTGDAAVIPALSDVVADIDEEESVRLNAVLGLTELDDKLRDYKEHKRLMRVLQAPMVDMTSSVAMRRACVYAYAAAYDGRESETLQPVRGRFTNDPSIEVQIAAVIALGDINDKDAVPLLVSIGLSHIESEVRAATAIALGRITSPEACIPALSNACRDEDPLTRREALDAISRHHNHNRDLVYNTLVAGLSDFDSLVRESAALALSRLSDTRAIEPLLQATGDRTYIVRQAAAMSLGALITPEREKEAYALVDLLGDTNPDVQSAALGSLRMISKSAEAPGSSDPAVWRVYFHTKYPETNPASLYAGKPKPRLQSGINSTGARRTTQQPNRAPQWNQNRNRNTQNRNTNWNQNRNTNNRIPNRR